MPETRKETWLMGSWRAMESLRALNVKHALAALDMEASQKKTISARLRKLVAIARSVARGMKLVEAYEAFDISSATLHRWLTAFSNEGARGLANRYDKVGRKKTELFTPEEEARFQAIYLQTARKTYKGNASQAARIFAEEHSGLAQALSARKTKYNLPSAVTRAIRKLNSGK